MTMLENLQVVANAEAVGRISEVEQAIIQVVLAMQEFIRSADESEIDTFRSKTVYELIEQLAPRPL